MAVPDLAAAKITRFCESRTPPQLRDEMRLQVDVRGDSVTILDCRPLWHGAPGEWTQMKIAPAALRPDGSLLDHLLGRPQRSLAPL